MRFRDRNSFTCSVDALSHRHESLEKNMAELNMSDFEVCALTAGSCGEILLNAWARFLEK